MTLKEWRTKYGRSGYAFRLLIGEYIARTDYNKERVLYDQIAKALDELESALDNEPGPS
jgi:hypothetical protein